MTHVEKLVAVGWTIEDAEKLLVDDARRVGVAHGGRVVALVIFKFAYFD
jgi:hypothetical protein